MEFSEFAIGLLSLFTILHDRSVITVLTVFTYYIYRAKVIIVWSEELNLVYTRFLSSSIVLSDDLMLLMGLQISVKELYLQIKVKGTLNSLNQVYSKKSIVSIETH